MCHHFLESLETPIVHVGRREGQIAKAWGIEGTAQAVVVELVIREVGPAVTVKAVGAKLSAAGFVFGEEEIQASLFLFGQLRFP